MKYIIISITFFLLTYTNISAQQYLLKFEEVTNNGLICELDIYMSYTSTGKLGSSNLVFSYDTTVLSNPSMVSDNLTLPFFASPSLTTPNINQVSLNIVLNVPNFGDNIDTKPNWTNLCRVRFDIIQQGDPNLIWLYTGGTRQTVVFKDDQSTILLADTLINMSSTKVPVELSYFKARNIESSSIQLDWETVSETENDYFEVQRKALDGRWEAIGKVKGQGTSSSPVQYQFLDEKAHRGVNYYRLKQVDYSGIYEFSPIQNASVEIENKIVVYPTITSGKLQFERTEPFDKAISISILNLSGQLVQQFDFPRGQSRFHIDIHQLPKGMYILRANDSTILSSQKILKL